MHYLAESETHCHKVQIGEDDGNESEDFKEETTESGEDDTNEPQDAKGETLESGEDDGNESEDLKEETIESGEDDTNEPQDAKEETLESGEDDTNEPEDAKEETLEDSEEDIEKVIKRSKDILARFCRAADHKSGKRKRSPLPQKLPRRPRIFNDVELRKHSRRRRKRDHQGHCHKVQIGEDDGNESEDFKEETTESGEDDTNEPQDAKGETLESGEDDGNESEDLKEETIESGEDDTNEPQDAKEETLESGEDDTNEPEDAKEETLEDSEEDIEKVIKRSKDILACFCRAADHKSGKRKRSPLPQKLPRQPRIFNDVELRKHSRRRRKRDHQGIAIMVDLKMLRFSQLTIKETFQCGRPISQLVNDLCTGMVGLDEPFLRLTAYETTDEETNRWILKCIDNRRLFALKEYARKTQQDEQDCMVHINYISQDAIHKSAEKHRIRQNSDCTSGLQVCMRRRGRCSV